MDNRISVEIVASRSALDRPRTAGTARLWVGESEQGQIQVAFDGSEARMLLTAAADDASAEFYDAYIMQSLINGDDSAETQIRETRRFWTGFRRRVRQKRIWLSKH
jgi:hypothetical protein